MTTDMGMVERCAQAIYDADPRSGWWADWDELVAEDATRHAFLRSARAVLECLRTPTPEMVEAGETGFTGNPVLGMHGSNRRALVNAYSAMIDRAMSPSNGVRG